MSLLNGWWKSLISNLHAGKIYAMILQKGIAHNLISYLKIILSDKYGF